MVAGREIFSSPHVAPEKSMGLSFAAPRAGRDDHAVALSEQVVIISIHAPLAGCDSGMMAIITDAYISIHAPLAGCDTVSPDSGYDYLSFQSTHPLRGATLPPLTTAPPPGYFNPRTPCGVRLKAALDSKLSTHFNPRTPCGVRPCTNAVIVRPSPFQSTHPLRGATQAAQGHRAGSKFQSTHPLRGATGSFADLGHSVVISIHAPLAGCDKMPSKRAAPPRKFQSTHPLRGATRRHHRREKRLRNFNPRTPCGVRPEAVAAGLPRLIYFNPRTPCGVRLPYPQKCCGHTGFQSTHPLRGATAVSTKMLRPYRISIHAPLAGCDSGLLPAFARAILFQSTHPLRGATRHPHGSGQVP